MIPLENRKHHMGKLVDGWSVEEVEFEYKEFIRWVEPVWCKTFRLSPVKFFSGNLIVSFEIILILN